jgi:hypothetical protein
MKLFKKLKRKQMMLMLATLVLMGACGKVRFELDKSLLVPLNVVTTIEEAAVKCAEAEADGTIETSEQNIIFAEKGECEWSVGDNLSKCNGKIRARAEEYVDLDLPDNATLCDIDFDFKEDDDMLYDDELILTLGGKVLFMTQDYSANSSSSKYNPEGLSVNSLGLVEYSWLGDANGEHGLRGLFYGWQQAPQYCLGGTEATCDVPLSQHTGAFDIDIPSDKIIEIGMLNGLTFDDGEAVHVPTPLQIGFISTGDNDRSDCQHTEVELDVKLKYIVLD